MVRNFFPVALLPFNSRDALTFPVRRRLACGAGAKTSSRASIMINSQFEFLDVNARRFQTKQNLPGFKNC
jgi:hypothetical protein